MFLGHFRYISCNIRYGSPLVLRKVDNIGEGVRESLKLFPWKELEKNGGKSSVVSWKSWRGLIYNLIYDIAKFDTRKSKRANRKKIKKQWPV